MFLIPAVDLRVIVLKLLSHAACSPRITKLAAANVTFELSDSGVTL